MGIERRRYLTGVGTTISGLALAGCSSTDSGSADGVKLLHHDMVADDEKLVVNGEAKNVSGTEIAYAVITVDWLEGKAFYSSSSTSISDLSPGETKGFTTRKYRTSGKNVITDYRIRVEKVVTTDSENSN